MNEELKAVRWVGSSQKDVQSFPPEVRRDVGHALYAAQKGETDSAVKPLKGFGGHSVMEIVAPFDGNTWRTVYTVRFHGQSMCFMPSRRNRSRALRLRKPR